ncbi:MAG: DNA photolyase, partial [Leptospiraceae bacterium]|nr:DNA photolyase [Leptospiraceae bacterium]
MNETKTYLKAKNQIYLSISYDNDILSFENWLGYCKIWIEFARENHNFNLEIRTKSSNFKTISHLPIAPNVILAWTLSPDAVIKQYEKKTPTLNRRIQNLLEATRLGWKTRICMDPILFVKNWKSLYSEMIAKIFSFHELRKIHDITLGSFRMNVDQLKKIRNLRADSDILYYPFERQNSNYEYKQKHKQE